MVKVVVVLHNLTHHAHQVSTHNFCILRPPMRRMRNLVVHCVEVRLGHRHRPHCMDTLRIIFFISINLVCSAR